MLDVLMHFVCAKIMPVQSNNHTPSFHPHVNGSRFFVANKCMKTTQKGRDQQKTGLLWSLGSSFCPSEESVEVFFVPVEGIV